jgi:hypothetical protein
VWCVVCGVWCVVCGVWCGVCVHDGASKLTAWDLFAPFFPSRADDGKVADVFLNFAPQFKVGMPPPKRPIARRSVPARRDGRCPPCRRFTSSTPPTLTRQPSCWKNGPGNLPCSVGPMHRPVVGDLPCLSS